MCLFTAFLQKNPVLSGLIVVRDAYSAEQTKWLNASLWMMWSSV